jgi:hypothetical protein
MGFDSLRPDVTPFLESLQNGGNICSYVYTDIYTPFLQSLQTEDITNYLAIVSRYMVKLMIHDRC